MTVKIDKDFPAPNRPTKGSSKYPWFEMEVGDSFLFEAKRALWQAPATPQSLKDRGWKFTSQREGKARRVWRIA